MLDALQMAVKNIDWAYPTLSRWRYNDSIAFSELGKSHWLERPFAYEIYHQLRLIWDKQELKDKYVIQAEVLKNYQEIRELKKMPDLLIHKPDSNINIAVVEIKIASNPKKELQEDLEKLILFRRLLGYTYLVEILIGTDKELKKCVNDLEKLRFGCDVPIWILTVSLDDKRTEILRLNSHS